VSADRKLLGYRVVRENPQTGEREWWWSGRWQSCPFAAESPRSVALRMIDDESGEGRVVAVYLRIVRKRKGGE